MSVKINHYFIDNLTGIYDKDFFLEAGSYILQLAIRHQFSFSLCIVDVDDLQAISTKYSHGISNQILESIAQVILHECRQSDIMAYLGEGKIGLLLNNISSADTQRFVNDLQRTIEEYEHTFLEKKITATVHIGICIAESSMHKNTFGQIYSKALAALNLAKKKGKNCIEVY